MVLYLYETKRTVYVTDFEYMKPKCIYMEPLYQYICSFYAYMKAKCVYIEPKGNILNQLPVYGTICTMYVTIKCLYETTRLCMEPIGQYMKAKRHYIV